MGRQRRTFQSAKSIATTALVGLGLAILFEKVGGPAAQLDTIFGCAAKETMGLLLYIVPAGWRALESYVLDYQGFSPCPVHMLVSCWSLLQVVAGAA